MPNVEAKEKLKYLKNLLDLYHEDVLSYCPVYLDSTTGSYFEIAGVDLKKGTVTFHTSEHDQTFKIEKLDGTFFNLQPLFL